MIIVIVFGISIYFLFFSSEFLVLKGKLCYLLNMRFNRLYYIKVMEKYVFLIFWIVRNFIIKMEIVLIVK